MLPAAPQPASTQAQQRLTEALAEVTNLRHTYRAHDRNTLNITPDPQGVVAAVWNGWRVLGKRDWASRSDGAEHITYLLHHPVNFWAATTVPLRLSSVAKDGSLTASHWESWNGDTRWSTVKRCARTATTATAGTLSQFVEHLTALSDQHLPDSLLADPWDPWSDETLDYWAGLWIALNLDPQLDPQVPAMQLLAGMGGFNDIAALVAMR